MVVVLTYRAHQHPAPILSLVHQGPPTVALGELELVFLSIFKACQITWSTFQWFSDVIFWISWYSFASTSQESFFPSAYPAQRKESLIVFLWPGVKFIGCSGACIWAIYRRLLGVFCCWINYALLIFKIFTIFTSSLRKTQSPNQWLLTRSGEHVLTAVIVDHWHRDLVKDVRNATSWT